MKKVNWNFVMQWCSRSSRSQMFFKICVIKNAAIFTGKHLCCSLLLIEFIKNLICNFIKKRLQHRCFPVNIAKSLGTVFFYRTPPVAPSVLLIKSCMAENWWGLKVQLYSTLKQIIVVNI